MHSFVLAGAKLDVQLIKSSKSSATVSFSRAMVLQRLHGRVSFVDNIKYRTQLLQVLLHAFRCLPCFPVQLIIFDHCGWN